MTTTDIAGLSARLRASPLLAYRKEAADTIERQAAEVERLRALLMLARPFVADDTEATCDLADRIDAALGL